MRDLVRRDADAVRPRMLIATGAKATRPQSGSHWTEARFAAEWAKCTLHYARPQGFAGVSPAD